MTPQQIAEARRLARNWWPGACLPAVDGKPTIQFTLKVTDPVYERLSMFCVRRRTNKQAALTDALLRYLHEETSSGPVPRAVRPTWRR